MLKDFNDFRALGRLGTDIELHQPQQANMNNGNGKSSGSEVRATFRLATSRLRAYFFGGQLFAKSNKIVYTLTVQFD